MKQGWEYKKFESCINKTPKPKQVKTEEYNSGTTYPIVSQEDKLISGYYDDESYVFHIDSPVVIFGDHTRVLKYIDFDFVVGADGVKIISPKQELDAKFLLYYLQWYKIPNLGYSRHYKLLKEINIPLPPKSTQLAIVSELDKINELIRLKKEQLKDFDNLAQSIFYEMFGDPVENEMGWEVKKLKDICEELFAGGDVPKANCSKTKEGSKIYPIYTNGIVNEGLYGYTDIVRVDKPSLTISARGTIGAVFKREANYYPAIRLITVVPQDKLLDLDYTMFALKGLCIEGAGGTIPQLTVPTLKLYNVQIPPLPLQHLFAQRIEQIEHQKAEVQKAITDLETLLASRMQYWFE